MPRRGSNGATTTVGDHEYISISDFIYIGTEALGEAQSSFLTAEGFTDMQRHDAAPGL